MRTLKTELGTDKNKEREGIWVDVMENEDGSIARFKVAILGSTNKKLMREQAKRARRASKFTPLEKQQKDAREIFVDTVLLGWENVIDYREDGDKRMEYNRDNALFLMEDIPHLLDLLSVEASEKANFREEEREEAGKNS